MSLTDFVPILFPYFSASFSCTFTMFLILFEFAFSPVSHLWSPLILLLRFIRFLLIKELIEFEVDYLTMFD